MSRFVFRKKWLLALLLTGLATDVLAIDDDLPGPTPIPRAQPVEKPKKPNILRRLFRKKATPAPTPYFEPVPTPKPKSARKRPKTTSTETAAETPETEAATTDTPNPGLAPLPDIPPSLENAPGTSATASSTPLPASLPPLVGGSVVNTDDPTAADLPPVATPTPLPAPTPIADEIRNNPLNQPIPLVDDGMALQITPDATPSPENLAEERAHFQKAKARALEDAKLQDLKAKTERAATASERYSAFKEYYPRLFASMRKIDGSLSDQIDEMEAAARRRLERMQSEQPGNPPAP